MPRAGREGLLPSSGIDANCTGTSVQYARLWNAPFIDEYSMFLNEIYEDQIDGGPGVDRLLLPQASIFT